VNRINHTTPLTIATLLMSVLLTSCATNSKAPEDTPVTPKVPLLVPDAPEVTGMNPRNLIPPVALPESAEERFDVVANKVPAAAFFNSLVDGSGFNLVVHPEVKGNISLNLKNVTVREALSAVRDLYGYDFNESGYGIQILPKSLQTRIFPINYLNVVRKGRSGMKVSNGMNNEEDTEAKNVFG
jgi:MSHA biogenesis protein MshL